MQYAMDMEADRAEDAFWWLVLQGLRARMRVSTVTVTVEEGRPAMDPLDRLERVRRDRDMRFTVVGSLLEMVTPIPPASSSMREIGLMLASSPSVAAVVPSSPSPPPTAPAADPVGRQPDDSSTRFGLMELD